MYAGEQYDPDLGLYYNRARYLNTGTGRFWSQDSYEGNAPDPASLHKYLYANCDPANRIDPSGNFSLSEIGATINIYTNMAVLWASQYQTAITIGSALLSLLNIGLFISSEEYRETTFSTVGPAAAAQALAQDVNVIVNVGKSFANILTVATAANIAETPADLARGFQGSGNYPGIDRWKDIILKKGTIVYAGEPGAGGFFTTGRAVESAGGDATKLFEGLQVASKEIQPGVFTYRPGVTAYEVLEDTPAAFGIVRANPQHGPGGFPQVYVPNFKDTLRPFVSYPLTNRIAPSNGGQ